jgi:ABC-type methionine transport system permease subunit
MESLYLDAAMMEPMSAIVEFQENITVGILVFLVKEKSKTKKEITTYIVQTDRASLVSVSSLPFLICPLLQLFKGILRC